MDLTDRYEVLEELDVALSWNNLIATVSFGCFFGFKYQSLKNWLKVAKKIVSLIRWILGSEASIHFAYQNTDAEFMPQGEEIPNCTAACDCHLAQLSVGPGHASKRRQGLVALRWENPTKLQAKCSQRAICGKKGVQGSTFKMCFFVFCPVYGSVTWVMLNLIFWFPSGFCFERS